MPTLLEHFLRRGEERREEVKRLEAASKAADYYFKSLPEDEQKKLAPTPEEWGHLNLEDRVGAARGHNAAINTRENLAQIQSYGALEDERTAQAESRRQAGADEHTVGEFVKNYMTAPEPRTGIAGYDEAGTAVETPDAPQGMEGRFRYAAEQTESFSGRHLPRAIEALTKYSTATAKADKPYEVKEGKTSFGVPWMTYGHTMQAFPQANALEAGPTESDDGNFFWNGKAWLPRKPVPEPGAEPLTSPDGKFYWNGTRWVAIRPEDPITVMLRDRLNVGKTNAPASAPAASVPALRFRKNPKTGQVESY